MGGIRGVRHEDRDDDGNDGDDDFRIRRLVVTYGIIMLAWVTRMKNAFQRVKKKLDQKNVKLEAVAHTCEKFNN